MTMKDFPTGARIVPRLPSPDQLRAALHILPDPEQAKAVYLAMTAAAPQPADADPWTTAPPTEQAWYWHWNGNPEAKAFPLSILYSGSSHKCFVAMGQLAPASSAVFCDVYGGYWKRMREPDTQDLPPLPRKRTRYYSPD